MRIEVIEGGRPDGTDFVMGAHHHNPIARANAEPQRMVPAISLGEGYAALGVTLEPMIAEEGDEKFFCAVLSVVGGRESKLVPLVPVKVILGELGRVKVSDLRLKLAEAIDGPKEPQ